MNTTQTIRYACYECTVVFDLCVAPTSEWLEQYEDIDDHGEVDITPVSCPFCGSSDLKAANDRPIIV